MTKLSRKIFSRTNKKYFSSEIIASLLALVLSVTSAVMMDKITDSDALICIVSALGGTLGFLAGTSCIYTLLHIRQYRRKERHFTRDMKSMLMANMYGIVVMYAFRIPCQYILQKMGIIPAFSATIAQFLSGLIGTAVRVYRNYKANIFGDFNSQQSPSD
ncbi:MAG: hypothetical protein WBC22_15545 [Sedimentisphaerales bacterium]